MPYYIYSKLFDLQLLWQVLRLAPVVPLGVWAGKWVATRVDKATFEKIIVVLLIISALLLTFR